MKNKSTSQAVIQIRILLLKLISIGILTTPSIVMADLNEAYFIAHQVAQSHQIPKILKGNTKDLVDEILAELIKNHKQKESIKQHYEDKATLSMLKKSIADSVSLPEFNSWLNEKIATIYIDIYDEMELKQMYKNSQNKNIKDIPLEDMNFYLSQYINSNLSYKHKKEIQKQLFLKKLKEETQDILNQHIKPDNQDKDSDEYY